MASWWSFIFYEVKNFESLIEGEYYWFDHIEDFPQFKDSVFPFTLPMKHPNFRSTRESIKIGSIDGVVLDDLILFMTKTEIAVHKLTDDKTQAALLGKGPACIYPTLRRFTDSFDMDRTGIRFRGQPIDTDMEPLFKYFRLTLIVNETLRFKKPLRICITLDSYKKIEERPEKLVETPHEQT